MPERNGGEGGFPLREAVLLLGSNLGRRVLQIRAAVERISRETEVTGVSRMYASEPFGRRNQPWFLNLAVRAATSLSPGALLLLAKRVEREAGRRGGARWGPRALDVDILLLGNEVIELPDLAIPHPSLAERRFFLRPAADVAPDALVPGLGRTVSQLLEACADPLEVVAL